MFMKIISFLFATSAIAICSQASAQRPFGEADANQDQKIDATELKQFLSGRLRGFNQFDALFKELDADENGVIDEKEFGTRMAAARKIMGGRPEANRNARDANQRPSRQRPQGLKVGEIAPSFKLKSLDGKSATSLASFKGKKPVVLIFGSYS